MTDLLPCPFCGAKAEIVIYDPEESWDYRMEIEHDESCWLASPRPSVRNYYTKAEAISAWNTRTFKAVYEDGNLCRIVTDTDTYIPERTCRITSEEYDDLLDVFTTHFSCGHCGIGMAGISAR